MTIQHNQEIRANQLDEKSVENYLAEHPGFLSSRPKLLAEMDLEHQTGAATSLIERQVVVLREQNRHYRKQLHELVEIARENDKLIAHLQHLTLSLFDTDELNDILALLQQSLRHDFHADAVTLCLFAEPGNLSLDTVQEDMMDILFLEQDDEKPVAFTRVLEGGIPICGKVKAEHAEYLFGDKATTIASVAQIPLTSGAAFSNSPSLGMIAIGARDPDRFHAGVGTIFLKYLGELISRKLSQQLQLHID